MTGKNARLIGVGAAAALTAAALTLGASGSEPPASYVCTGDAAFDQAKLEPLISAGGQVTLHGPRPCAGNYVTSNVTVRIVGAGGGATMDGGGAGSILIADHAKVTLSNLTLTNGAGSGKDEPEDAVGANGGAVSMTDSTLTVRRCRIVGNRAGDQGGGIHATESTIALIDSTLSGNASREGGGGIDADEDVDVTITRSTIAGNATGPHGGGVELFDGKLTVTDSTIRGNRLTGAKGFRSGGGIWTGMSVTSLTRTTVSRNSSTEFGGGIGFSGGKGSSLALIDSTVVGNRARLGGGGIRNDAYYGDAPVVVRGSTIAGNVARQGGGIENYGLHRFTASVALASSVVAGNRASLGGGVHSFVDPSGGAATISVASTTIGARPGRPGDGNRADFGGGLALDGAHGPVEVELGPGTRLAGNVARHGGGVFRKNGARVLTREARR